MQLREKPCGRNRSKIPQGIHFFPHLPPPPAIPPPSGNGLRNRLATSDRANAPGDRRRPRPRRTQPPLASLTPPCSWRWATCGYASCCPAAAFAAASETPSRDPLLWRRLAVEPPLSHRITDEVLLELTDKTEGRLRSLHLLGCPRVSDAGLLRVVERNPFIAELFVPRCTGLTADGLVKVVRFLNEHKGNLSRLRLHGICKMTNHHLDIFNTLMCKSSQRQDAQALYYNHRVHEVLNTDDERPIDVDVCPMCRNVRLVFDCTRDDCRKVKDSWPHCRGCFFCVARCETCGGCIDLEELGGTGLACSDFLCTDCWLKLPKCCTCNRPYCERHSTLKENLSPSGQFTCQECMAFGSLGNLEDGY